MTGDVAKPRRRTQAERTAATTDAIIAASRELFAAKGYAATSIEDIVGAVGMTRGALYHHFSGKADVFRAVFEAEVKASEAYALMDVDAGEDPWALLSRSGQRILEYCSDPGVYRIMFADAASVIPWDEVQATRRGLSEQFIRTVLEMAMASGQIDPRPIDPLMALMFGSVRELAFMVVGAEDRERALREGVEEIAALLEAIRKN